MKRQATPTRGAMLLASVVHQRARERAGVRPGAAGHDRRHGGEVRRRVEVDHLAVLLGERPQQLVAEPEVEGQRRALAPVVLHEQAHRSAVQLDVAGPVLQARLLRQPEQEVGEVEAVAARGRRAARGVQAGEDERPARVRIGAVARGVPPVVAAEPQRVRPDRPRPGVGRRDAPVGALRRIEIAHARQAAERQIGNAPVERIGRDAGDAGVAGDVHDVRIPIDGLRRVLRQGERHRCAWCGGERCSARSGSERLELSS